MKTLADIIKEQPEGQTLIPEFNFEKFSKKLETLSNKAVKLGFDPIEISILDADVLIESEEYDFKNQKTYKVITPCVRLTYKKHPPVRMQGSSYEFIAKLVHGPEGNIVCTAPGAGQDTNNGLARYYNAEPWCDHCKSKRFRKETFVLRTEGVYASDWKYVQVGRQCLKDFFGYNKDVEKLIEYASIAEAAGNLFASDWISGEGYNPVVRSVQYVAHVIAAMKATGGYRSVTYCREHGHAWFNSTAGMAWHSCMPKKDNPLVFNGKDVRVVPIEADYAKANELCWELALMYNNGLPSSSGYSVDFEHNVHTILKRGYVEYTTCAYLAGRLANKLKDLLPTKVAKEKRYLNNKIGERVELKEVTLKYKRSFDSTYGFTSLHVMEVEDAEGHTCPLTWWASGTGLDIEEGDKVSIKATIKEFKDDAKYGITTVLTRVKKLN